jgi:sugar phosphate isomerase/epimerase
MKLGMMTLGCPSWDLDTICRRAHEYGFDGVDFRGLKEEIEDVSRSPQFCDQLSETIQKIKDNQLEVSALSTSILICEKDSFEKNINSARRLIPLAKQLKTKVIRVFGRGNLKSNSRPQLVEFGKKMMSAILELDGAQELQWLLETHDEWIQSNDSLVLINGVKAPNFGILWDICHTVRIGKESPMQTLEVLGPYIRYVHIKDAVRDATRPHGMDGDWHYVAPGEGEIPLVEAVQLLRKKCDVEWLTFEHEKRWKPHLDEPEVIFPKFIRWAQQLNLQAA